VWNEGMLLTPHHFQQWDNYHEDQLNSRLNSVMPYGWGILDLQINNEAIANGLFDLIRCRMVMPDGLHLNIPQVDAAPDARPVEGHFSPELEKLDVHLAIPAKRVGAANFQTSGGERIPTVRYWQEPGIVVDETTGQNEQQLPFARNNLRILFGSELREGYSAIKIAELERTATGQLKISENYIPPVLNITASSWLVNMLRQLVEILITKSSSLGDKRRQRAASLADFTTSEVAVFWLLNTVNSSLPGLAHLFRTPMVHPERLYSEMIQLAGKLTTFAIEHHPKDIVRYEHRDLYFTFSQLSAQIRELLELVIPDRCVPIPLEKTRESLYVGRVQDERLLKEAAFYFGIRSQVPESKLIERVPIVIKIGSRDVIDAIIGSGLPGVTMRHASPPPAPIPTRVGFHYFALDSIGPFWEAIRGSQTLAVYVPDEFPDEKVEMYAVKP
jgi:type VI secretion system protein ImpJ